MLITVGCIPWRTIKEKARIIEKLKKDHKRIKVEVHDDSIYYEVKEKKESNIYL